MTAMRKMMAVMLMGLAFTAAQVESGAQSRRMDDRKPAATTNHRKPSGSTSAERPTTARPSPSRPVSSGSTASRPAVKPGDQNKPIGVTRPGGQPAGKPDSRPVRPDVKPGGTTKPSGPATKPSGPTTKPSGPSGQKPGGPSGPGYAPAPGGPKPTGPKPGGPKPDYGYRPGPKPGPQPPRPGFAPAPRPPKPPKPVIVVRPSYGSVIAANIASQLIRSAVIASAVASYSTYNGLKLTHSYVSNGTEYYYQDGVFYIVDAFGQYRTIIPPTGALVEYLPDDYTTFRRGGDLFYRVDDTVYTLRLIDGQPLFEVLGQL